MVSYNLSGQMLWIVNPYGDRERIFCKTCLAEGKDWLSKDPCDHILAATGQPASPQQVQEALQKIGPATQASLESDGPR